MSYSLRSETRGTLKLRCKNVTKTKLDSNRENNVATFQNNTLNSISVEQSKCPRRASLCAADNKR